MELHFLIIEDHLFDNLMICDQTTFCRLNRYFSLNHILQTKIPERSLNIC